MVAERFEHSDVTAAPNSVALSRVHCPEPFGKTRKSSFNAGQRSLLCLLNVSNIQTLRQRQIQPPGCVSIAQNPSARLRNPVLMPANDPYCGCLTFRTLRRNGSAGFSRPVAFPLRRTLREDSEIQFYCRRMISFMIVERFAHAHVTAAPDSAARSRFYCSEPFGKTHKSSFIAGQRSLLWLFDVSHTQT